MSVVETKPEPTKTGSRRCPSCGYVSGGKPRSIAQHRRYFALIAAAWHHWPEAHGHQFDSAEHLRIWLQMRAGHKEVGAQVPLYGVGRERAMLIAEAAIEAAGSYAQPVVDNDCLVVYRPKSIAFGRLSQAAFCGLNDEIAQIIEAETGLKADQLLKSPF